MRRSLTELYLLNYDAAYYNAFLYIRQLAIHLRNALTLKKKVYIYKQKYCAYMLEVTNLMYNLLIKKIYVFCRNTSKLSIIGSI